MGFPYSDDSVIAGVLYARLAGDYAGLVVRSVSRHFDEVAEIRSYDLSRRRVTHLAQHYLGGTHNDSTVTDFELGPSGAFAYIVHCTFVCAGSPAPGFEVYLVDGPACARTPCGQRFARVDDGAGIVPDSLAVSGSALYWTKDGQPGSTPIE